MKFKLHLLSAAVVLAVILPTVIHAGYDPGEPDTVKFEGGPLVIGQSIPLTFTIVNDEELGSYCLGFIFDSSPGGGFAVFDSIVYINRMADPTVLSFRIAKRWDNTPGSPDSVLFGGEKYAGEELPVGTDPIGLAYFTGVTPGSMSIGWGNFPPAADFLLVNNAGTNTWVPQVVLPDIEVIEGNPPPEITILTTTPRVEDGTTVEFGVQGYSSIGVNISLELVNLIGYDNDARLPANDPAFGSGNPAQFSWTTTADDIGIWLATFRVCDAYGTCVTAAIDIQVVDGPSYLLSFSMGSTYDVCRSSALHHGNFDGDLNPELIGTGSAEIRSTPTLELFDYNGSDSLGSAYRQSDYYPEFGLQIGYFNDDPHLDAVTMKFHDGGTQRVAMHYGTGDNGFLPFEYGVAGNNTRNTTLGEFTGDSYLDFASASIYTGVQIYAGGGLWNFPEVYSIFEPSLSVNSADFNDDGYDDLAIGTEYGIKIYLATGTGGFTLAHTYSQMYGALDIEVTNQGSDFNNDNIFDLCISTPSVGGQYSQMVVYLGVGDGSFTQHVIRNVKGQIFGNCVGDFNGDTELDIACVNGAREYVAVLFGDGTGSFVNEIRYTIPHENPRFIDCFDVDLDGDLDIAAGANGYLGYNSLYLFTNQLDPEGFMQAAFDISACDNGSMELASHSGRVINAIKSTMPSGSFFRRSLNGNSTLDESATLALVESGEYTMTVTPKANLSIGQPFTVEFELNGEPYRLARDVPMNETGYRFGLCAEESSAILPRPGKFIIANPPSFSWGGSGQYDFQLADNIEFVDPVVSAVVDDNTYSPVSPLTVSDTTMYFWRVKPHGAADYDYVYVVNMVAGSTSYGDASGDGVVNLADAVFLVNFIFKNGAPPEPLCVGDINGDGEVNIGDAVHLINYIFKGGPPPEDAC